VESPDIPGRFIAHVGKPLRKIVGLVINCGRFGVFVLGGIFSGGATPEQAREIERLGYGTLWVFGSPPAELSFAEPLLESTPH
jgi:hypothetical protein